KAAAACTASWPALSAWVTSLWAVSTLLTAPCRDFTRSSNADMARSSPELLRALPKARIVSGGHTARNRGPLSSPAATAATGRPPVRRPLHRGRQPGPGVAAGRVHLGLG